MRLKKFENFTEYNSYSNKEFDENNYTVDHEDDDEFVITKIVENFPFDEVKSRIEDESEDDKETALLDMIVWFRSTYGKEIKNEDYILDRLRQEYDIN